jgi:hypothetical protein
VQASIIAFAPSWPQISFRTGNSWLAQADVPLGSDLIQKSTTWFNLAFKKALLLLLLLLLVWGLLKKDAAPATTEDISTTIIIITNIFFPLIIIMYNVQFDITSIYK